MLDHPERRKPASSRAIRRLRKQPCLACKDVFTTDAAQPQAFLLAVPAATVTSVSGLCAACDAKLSPGEIELACLKTLSKLVRGRAKVSGPLVSVVTLKPERRRHMALNSDIGGSAGNPKRDGRISLTREEDRARTCRTHDRFNFPDRGCRRR